MLSVFISGHSEGIGAALYDFLKNEKKYEVFGGGRREGFAIHTEEGRHRIIEKCRDVECIVLSAHSGFSQTQLVYELYGEFKSTTKTIIVLGSHSACGIKEFPHKYAVEKKALRAACSQLNMTGSSIRVIYLAPSWVRTKRVENLTTEPMLTTDDICSVVNFVIENRDRIVFSEIAMQSVQPEGQTGKPNPWGVSY